MAKPLRFITHFTGGCGMAIFTVEYGPAAVFAMVLLVCVGEINLWKVAADVVKESQRWVGIK